MHQALIPVSACVFPWHPRKMKFPHGVFVITTEQHKFITETFKYVTGRTLSKLNTVLSFLTSWKAAHAGVLHSLQKKSVTKAMILKYHYHTSRIAMHVMAFSALFPFSQVKRHQQLFVSVSTHTWHFHSCFWDRVWAFPLARVVRRKKPQVLGSRHPNYCHWPAGASKNQSRKW